MGFKKGQRVHVEFDGVVDDYESPRGGFINVVDDKANFIHQIWVNPRSRYILTICDPEYWPPQAGDIWQVEGKEYAAPWASRPDDGNISVHGVEEAIMYDVQELKAMNPRLVRRRGVDLESERHRGETAS